MPYYLAAFCALLAMLAFVGPPSASSSGASQPDQPHEPAAVFELQDLITRQQESGRKYLPFFASSQLHTGIYALAKGAEDPQTPHEEDEVYYVLEGKARFRVGSADQQKTYDVQPGSIIYVQARAEHRFVDISQDLKLLVFFAKAKG